MPFANASKDSEMDYLGEGISEEITNSLSRLPNLQVMARSTVSHYKSRQDDPQGVGHDMHVDAVLTGRVVEHGSELSVETELVNVAKPFDQRLIPLFAPIASLGVQVCE